MPNEVTDETKEQIANELFSGRKIAAIKLCREATGLGLAESKKFIESLQAQLREQSPEKFTTQSSGCGSAAVLFLVFTGSIAYYFI